MSDSPAIQVPYTALSAETLRRLIVELVTRDGTDYGAEERTLEQKIADVERELVRGEATITFDPETETTNIVVADALRPKG